MKFVAFLNLFLTSTTHAFDIKPTTTTTNSRRAFLDVAGAAFLSAGSVALVTKEPVGAASPADASSDTAVMCELKNPFDIPNIASCHGEKWGMTPDQEAGADSLLTKFDLEPDDFKNN